MALLILIETYYVHASMHDVYNQRNTPKTRLNEILYIEKISLPALSSLSCGLSSELTSWPNGFPLQLIAYYVLYRINIAGVYTGVCESPVNDT